MNYVNSGMMIYISVRLPLGISVSYSSFGGLIMILHPDQPMMIAG